MDKTTSGHGTNGVDTAIHHKAQSKSKAAKAQTDALTVNRICQTVDNIVDQFATIEKAMLEKLTGEEYAATLTTRHEFYRGMATDSLELAKANIESLNARQMRRDEMDHEVAMARLKIEASQS